jgi:hypothetical protein
MKFRYRLPQVMKRKSQVTNNKSTPLIVLLLCSIGLVSCTKPVPIAFTNACQKENDNLYISVEGYLSTGTSLLCSSRDGTRACGLELLDSLDGKNKISVYLEEGTGNSQMEALPKNYSNENLKVHDINGQVLGAKDRLRVIGIAKNGNVGADSTFSVCYINVEKIERP